MRRGLSDSNGFWNTIWIARRTLARPRAGVPGQRLAVEAMRPAVGRVEAGDAAADRWSCRCPTRRRARRSAPGSTANDTPSAAGRAVRALR